jgi:hypothetical protein
MPKKKKKSSKKEKKDISKAEVKVSVEDSTAKKVKKIISYVIGVLLLILLLYIALTIKNALDDTMVIEADSERAQTMCSYDSCIIIDGEYEEGFVNWNVRDYWPFFSISIGTDLEFEEGAIVDIVCPVDLKTDTFQHIVTKFSFLYKKNNIKNCDLVESTED